MGILLMLFPTFTLEKKISKRNLCILTQVEREQCLTQASYCECTQNAVR